MLVLLASDSHPCSDMDDLSDATLRRIDRVINQDVEMQASCLSQ
jgi:hypothetical protein